MGDYYYVRLDRPKEILPFCSRIGEVEKTVYYAGYGQPCVITVGADKLKKPCIVTVSTTEDEIGKWELSRDRRFVCIFEHPKTKLPISFLKDDMVICKFEEYSFVTAYVNMSREETDNDDELAESNRFQHKPPQLDVLQEDPDLSYRSCVDRTTYYM